MMNSLNIIVKGYKHLSVSRNVARSKAIKATKTPSLMNRHIGLSLARAYSSQTPQNNPYSNVYDELEGLDDHYDPAWDYEYPEEEGTFFLHWPQLTVCIVCNWYILNCYLECMNTIM